MDEWTPITQLSFDDWIDAFFDNHPSGHTAYDEISDKTDQFKLAASTEIGYLTQLLENSEQLLAKYSNKQVNAGFWYLMGNAGYGVHHQLLHVTWPEQERCLRAMSTLFRSVFAKRCDPALSHLDESPNSLNLICYMWWDVDGLPFYSKGEPGIERMNAICREVMVETLNIDSIPCQESALHGLGHDHIYHPQFVEQVIDEYMAKNPNLRTALAAYAINASVGYVQ